MSNTKNPIKPKIILPDQKISNLNNKIENQQSDNEFYFQWHITNKCNLRCKHCYQSDYSNEAESSFEELKFIADKINDTLITWRKDGRIAITGGEPFVREDLINFLKYLDHLPAIKKISILTNGTLLENYIESLKTIKKLTFIQMSLEGEKERNDEIRGKNVFDKVISCTKLLYNNNIPVRWMVTLHKMNVAEVPYIIDLAIKNNVDTLVFERLVLMGKGKSMDSVILTPNELSKIYNYILCRSDEEYLKGTPLKIFKFRTLWILTDPDRADKNIHVPFQNEVGATCSIGMDSLCILPDATVLPCRRLPIPIGNLKIDNIFKIWYTSDLLWKIRDKRNLKGKCKSCDLAPRCSGCRSVAYAMTGDYLGEDPQCWKQ